MRRAVHQKECMELCVCGSTLYTHVYVCVSVCMVACKCICVCGLTTQHKLTHISVAI